MCWVNVREEILIVINDRVFVIRDVYAPDTTASKYLGALRGSVAGRERRGRKGGGVHARSGTGTLNGRLASVWRWQEFLRSGWRRWRTG